MATTQAELNPNPDQLQVNDSLSTLVPPPTDPTTTSHGLEPPKEGPSNDNSNLNPLLHARPLFNNVIEFGVRLPRDGVQTSIETFLKSCDSNPFLAVLVAAPIVFSVLMSVFLIIGSVVSLLLWAAATISLAALCIVIGGFISLFIKLHVGLWRYLPEGRFSEAVRGTAQYLVTTTDWDSIMRNIARGGAMTYGLLRSLASALSPLYTAASSLFSAMYSDVERTVEAMQHAESTSERDGETVVRSAPSTSTEAAETESRGLPEPLTNALWQIFTTMWEICRAIYSDVKKSLTTVQPVEGARGSPAPLIHTGVPVPLSQHTVTSQETTNQLGDDRLEQFEDAIEEEEDLEMIDIQPINISNTAREEGSAKGLKQRTPFTRLEG